MYRRRLIVDFRVDGLGLGGDIAARRVLLEVRHSRHFPCCLVQYLLDASMLRSPSRRLEGLTGSFSDFGCIFGFFASNFPLLHHHQVHRKATKRGAADTGGAFEYR